MKITRTARKAANVAMAKLPAILRDIMMANFPPTKATIKAGLKGVKQASRGGLTIEQCVAAIGATWPLVVAAGNEKDKEKRTIAQIGGWQRNVRGLPLRRAVKLPGGTLTERLAAKRRVAVRTAAERTLKFGATGGTKWNIRFGLAPNYRTETEKAYGVYSRSCTFAALVDIHHIAVPTDWMTRVARVGRGSGRIGGVMILDAKAVVDLGDRRIHEITYARQGRGYGVHVEHGFVSTWADGTANFYKQIDGAAQDPIPAHLKAKPAPKAIPSRTMPADDADAMIAMRF